MAHEDTPKTGTDDLEHQQPGGGLPPRLLVGIGAVLIVAAIVILIVVLSKT